MTVQAFKKSVSLLLALALFVLAGIPAFAGGRPPKKKKAEKPTPKSRKVAANEKKRKKETKAERQKGPKYAGENRKGKSSYATRMAASRAAAARKRAAAAAAARRRAEIARIKAIDDSLFRVAKGGIEIDDTRGEDPAIRKIAIEALGRRAGTVVIMDPNTGRVLSMVNQRWAVGKPFKPCSTIKVLTSYAALSEKVVDADAVIDVNGRGWEWTMRTALARSNNEYFQVLGRRLGFGKVVKYARTAGFGQKTGINVPGEISGYIPTNEPDDMGRTCSHGDGFGVTAIQLAAFTSAIANGGTFYRPQILRTKQEIAGFKPVVLRKIQLSDRDRKKILEGMHGAVSFGTARRSNTAALNVAGKTGSCNCETLPRTRVGLFTSFVDAPGHPGLVITVITTGSTSKGSAASVVAGNLYRNGAEDLPVTAGSSTGQPDGISKPGQNPSRPRKVEGVPTKPADEPMDDDDQDDEEGR
jgi:membrane carboxypeptidase/penicillin-binding protein